MSNNKISVKFGAIKVHPGVLSPTENAKTYVVTSETTCNELVIAVLNNYSIVTTEEDLFSLVNNETEDEVDSDCKPLQLVSNTTIKPMLVLNIAFTCRYKIRMKSFAGLVSVRDGLDQSKATKPITIFINRQTTADKILRTFIKSTKYDNERLECYCLYRIHAYTRESKRVRLSDKLLSCEPDLREYYLEVRSNERLVRSVSLDDLHVSVYPTKELKLPKKPITEDNTTSSERTMAKLKDSLSKLRSHLDKLHKREEVNVVQRQYQFDYKREGDDLKDESDSSLNEKAGYVADDQSDSSEANSRPPTDSAYASDRSRKKTQPSERRTFSSMQRERLQFMQQQNSRLYSAISDEHLNEFDPRPIPRSQSFTIKSSSRSSSARKSKRTLPKLPLNNPSDLEERKKRMSNEALNKVGLSDDEGLCRYASLDCLYKRETSQDSLQRIINDLKNGSEPLRPIARKADDICKVDLDHPSLFHLLQTCDLITLVLRSDSGSFGLKLFESSWSTKKCAVYRSPTGRKPILGGRKSAFLPVSDKNHFSVIAVDRIEEGSPAERAGILEGSYIIEANGTYVVNYNLEEVLNEFEDSDSVELVIARPKERLDQSNVHSAWPSNEEMEREYEKLKLKYSALQDECERSIDQLAELKLQLKQKDERLRHYVHETRRKEAELKKMEKLTRSQDERIGHLKIDIQQRLRESAYAARELKQKELRIIELRKTLLNKSDFESETEDVSAV
ncbi:DgyrCDS2826 [Dimorphilus gyrociliatus]|uniref:DgyrCDS2826 n=1 Tax=Dimorphilus gyrociliatus TaxID=2664684 RepID=A0A7I8VC08_9ANNE|nr:DgyrCDS2826 [Dimorphilus gyrociliatus]